MKTVSLLKRSEWFPDAKQRAFAVLFAAAGLVLVASLGPLHSWLVNLLSNVEPVIRAKPVLGMLVFVLLAAASAMLTFVSSAVIIAPAVYVWGEATSMLLLWIGWTLGGMGCYMISRYLGRPAVKALTSGTALERYENRISRRTPFALILLSQFALPSELLGYLLGLLRYPFWKYFAALGLAELPYALVAVYLGASFIERRIYRLAGLTIIMVVLGGWAAYQLHRRVPEDDNHAGSES